MNCRFLWCIVFLFCNWSVGTAGQSDMIDRVVVRYPQDRVVFETDTIYVLNIAPNYMCHIELPEPAEVIVVANPTRYEVISPNQYESASGAPPVSGPNSGKTVFVKALQVQQTPIPNQATTDQTLDTNMTVRLVSGRTLYLRLRNVTREEETVYGCIFYDKKDSSEKKQPAVSLVETSASTRAVPVSAPVPIVVDQSLMSSARSMLQTMMRSRDAARVAIQRREQDLELELRANRIGRYLAVAVSIQASRAYKLAQPGWKLDDLTVTPLVADPSFLPQTVNGRVHLGVVMDVPAWVAVDQIGPHILTLSLTVENRLLDWAVPLQGLNQLNNSRLKAQSPTESRPGAPDVSFQQAQSRLMGLMDSTSIRSPKITLVQEKEYAVGALAQGCGDWILVVVLVERRLGSRPLQMEKPAILGNGLPLGIESIIQPFSEQLETRPLTSGLLIKNSDGISALQYEMKVGSKRNRLSIQIQNSDASFEIRPAEPTPVSSSSDMRLQPRFEYQQDGVQIKSIDARQVRSQYWVSFIVEVVGDGEMTQMSAVSETGESSQCISSREQWAPGNIGKVTFVFPHFTPIVTLKWVRRGVNESSVFGPYSKR